MLEMSPLESLYGGQFTFRYQLCVDNLTVVSTPRWCITTVSLETYPLIHLLKNLCTSCFAYSKKSQLIHPYLSKAWYGKRKLYNLKSTFTFFIHF